MEREDSYSSLTAWKICRAIDVNWILKRKITSEIALIESNLEHV